MDLQGMDLRGLEISPYGRKAFLIIGAFNQPEIWALENFLPAGK